jgi:gluconolactonase
MLKSLSSPVAVSLIAEDLGFTEGPVWTRDGRLVVASVSRGLIYELPESGAPKQLAEPGGHPAGLAEDSTGSVWIAQRGTRKETRSLRHAHSGIQVLRANGIVEDVVTSGVNSPTDCAFGHDGRLWFSDPLEPAFTADGPSGRLCVLDTETGNVQVAATGLRFPNGLVFSADGHVLYVAETGAARIARYDVSDGSLAGATTLDLAGVHPDGLALDGNGRLYAAAPRDGAVIVLQDDGRVVERIRVGQGSFPTNLCFGGAHCTRLYITAGKGGRVYAVDRGTPGASPR